MTKLRWVVTALGLYLAAAAAAPVFAQDSVIDARRLVGEWTGSYSCSQGRTGLRLRITEGMGQSFRGSFEFFALPANPQARSGSYAITGSLNSISGAIAISAGAWIERPEGYEPVSLKGRVDLGAERMSGIVDNSSCTSFEVRRETYAGVGEAGSPALGFAAVPVPPAAGPATPPDPAFAAALHSALAAAMKRSPSDAAMSPYVACASAAFTALPAAEKQRLVHTAAMREGKTRAKALEGWINRVAERHPNLKQALVACG